MAKARCILLLFFILIIGSTGYSQNTNPFEIKSRAHKEVRLEKENNVFEINKESIDTTSSIEILETSNNPFEINNKQKSVKVERKQKNKSNSDTVFSSTGNSDFLLWLFLFILVFIAILLSINRNLILKIIKVVWYYNHTNSLLRNFGNRELMFYVFLFITFVTNFSIFVYLFIRQNHGISGLDFFLRVLGIISMIYVIKHLSIFLFNAIFPSLKGLVMYNFTVLLFNISLGLFLIPINLIVAYSLPSISSFFLIFGITIISIMYLIRLLRGFLVTYNYFSISIFHFFIYLCTFEILPLLFLYKYFINYF